MKKNAVYCILDKCSTLLCKAMAFEKKSQAFLFSFYFVAPLHRQQMHACTKGLVRFACFFMFYKSQVTQGPKKTKEGFLWIDIFFCLQLSLVSIYSHVQSTHSLSALFTTTTTLALQTGQSQSRRPLHIHSSLFFHSLQKFDVYITNFSATAVAFFETAAAEVRQRADGTRGSVFKSQKR